MRVASVLHISPEVAAASGRAAALPGLWRHMLAGAVCFAALIPCAGAEMAPLSGTWDAVDHTLDNGEVSRVYFELHQDGSALKGRFHTPGWGANLSGTIENGHFKLVAPFAPLSIFASGEVAGPNLAIVMEGNKKLLLKPEIPGDEPAAVAYIPPPPLKTLPPNGLAMTPPMGWNSWNRFGGGINDAIVRDVADVMVSSGMRDAGYIYLNIDDTWEGVRGEDGMLHANHKFPDMKGLADYVHSRGLRLGIYSSPGPRTCGGYPGSYGHEAQDAQQWAAWGIDYLKYDWCSAETVYQDADLQAIYQRMGEALQATKRPIVYSLCEYGSGHVETWGAAVGANLWRTTGDIRDEWDSMANRNGFSQNHLAPYAGPGHWNDPDMLEVGNGKMSDEEYRTHMSLWSLLASPLLAGNDLRTMTQATKAILLNREVIAIDQDSLGRQATRLTEQGSEDIWAKPLAGGGVAIGVFNRGTASMTVTLKAADLNLPPSLASGRELRARDLWAHKDVSFEKGEYSATIPAHGVLLLRTGPVK